jgi:hypothetical protein
MPVTINNPPVLFDANKDPKHWSYKVPGLIAWGLILFCILGVFLFPLLFLNVSRVIAFYMLLRVIWIVVFYLVGLIKITRTTKRVNSADEYSPPDFQTVQHVILLPNRAEPTDLLCATLEKLSKQWRANQSISVILAMEENDPNALDQSQFLVSKFREKFAHLVATFHPAGLQGELPGKASNETWAASFVRSELIAKQGMDPASMTITTCDADSVLHPGYFKELGRSFHSDPYPFMCIWQAPIFFDNNIRKVQPIVRLLSFFRNAVQLSELTMPLNMPLAQSTYSMSFELAERIHFWDPAVVCEDSHTRLRSLFALNHLVRLVPIFLPTTADAVEGKNFLDSIKAYYIQTVRHGWGGMDIGYLLQQIPGKPIRIKWQGLGFLLKLIHDHLLFSTVGIVILFSTPVSYLTDGSLVVTLPMHAAHPVLLTIINGSWAFGMGLIWITERIRSSSKNSVWNPKDLLLEVVCWLIFPFMTFAIMGIPVLQAQTIMMFGGQVSYVVTQKRLTQKV